MVGWGDLTVIPGRTDRYDSPPKKAKKTKIVFRFVVLSFVGHAKANMPRHLSTLCGAQDRNSFMAEECHSTNVLTNVTHTWRRISRRKTTKKPGQRTVWLSITNTPSYVERRPRGCRFPYVGFGRLICIEPSISWIRTDDSTAPAALYEVPVCEHGCRAENGVEKYHLKNTLVRCLCRTPSSQGHLLDNHARQSGFRTTHFA